MKKTRLKYAFLMGFLCCQLSVCAQNALTSYYASAKGKSGQELKSALAALIIQHKVLKYNDVWDKYASTDVTEDGRIWDMYSCVSRFLPGGVTQGQSGSGTEGTAYNREHSFPKSWWGNWNKGEAQYTDLFHLIPTDASVNSRRSNNAYGEVGEAKFSSHDGFSRLGAAREGLGYEGTVFEPNDVYKGDIARQYFYMVTCYEDSLSNWKRQGKDNEMITGEKYEAFEAWAQAMLMRWAKLDVVGPKEKKRNEAVYAVQENRNPFVDFPGLEEYIWGSLKDIPFDPDAYIPPVGREATEEETSLPYISTLTQTPSGKTYTFTKVTSSSGIEMGGTYVMVVESDKPCANGIPNANQLSACDVALADGSFTTEYVSQVGFPYPFTLVSVEGDGYGLQLEDGRYITNGMTSTRNNLNAFDNISEAACWQVDYNDGDVWIHNEEPRRGHIFFYSGSKFFQCGNKKEKESISLYKLTSVAEEGTGMGTPVQEYGGVPVYYNLQGIRCQPVRGIYLRRVGNRVDKVWIP